MIPHFPCGLGGRMYVLSWCVMVVVGNYQMSLCDVLVCMYVCVVSELQREKRTFWLMVRTRRRWRQTGSSVFRQIFVSAFVK